MRCAVLSATVHVAVARWAPFRWSSGGGTERRSTGPGAPLSLGHRSSGFSYPLSRGAVSSSRRPDALSLPGDPPQSGLVVGPPGRPPPGSGATVRARAWRPALSTGPIASRALSRMVSEAHPSALHSPNHLLCRLLL